MKSYLAGPSFTATKSERELVTSIVERAAKIAASHGISFSKIDTTMDLIACHANGCPLDFVKLLAAPDADFGHDVFGIRRHIDRGDGTLRDCFSPRCSLNEKGS